MVILSGCSHRLSDPPRLRTRPDFRGPHYEVPTYCIKRIEYYQGWCEDGQKPGELLCHDMVVVVPEACRVLKSTSP